MINLEGSPFSSYKIIRPLGSGTFGVVYLVRSPDHKDFVIKSINLENLSERKQARALKEVSILESQSHLHLITYFSSCINRNKLLILMEYASGGDLQQLINMYKATRKYMSEKTIWSMIFEICLGVEHLHKNNIIHRDIKCLNILLDKDKRLKIADMGVCKTVNSKDPMANSQVGTPLYLSPELIQHKPYDKKIDIWAIGCVAYNLAALEPPFQADNLIALARMIVKGRPKPIQGFYSPKLFEFILRLLDKRPAMRPSFEEIYEMIPSYVKGNYSPPSSFISSKPGLKTQEIKKHEGKPETVRPVSSNSKDRIGSIGKYPNRFKMYVLENSRLVNSRSLNMKPMPNFLNINNANSEVANERKEVVNIRPSSGVIRRDLDMNRTNFRPASAYSCNRTTVRDLESLD